MPYYTTDIEEVLAAILSLVVLLAKDLSRRRGAGRTSYNPSAHMKFFRVYVVHLKSPNGLGLV